MNDDRCADASADADVDATLSSVRTAECGRNGVTCIALYGRDARVTDTYIHTYISFLYSAYKFNRVTMRFGSQTSKFSEIV